MSAQITKILRNENNVLVYFNTNDETFFVGSSNAHLRPIGQTSALITDITGQQISVAYDGFEAISIDGVPTFFNGTFKEFIELLQTLFTNTGSGGPSVESDFKLEYDIKATGTTTNSTTFVDAFQANLSGLANGLYEIEFFATSPTGFLDVEVQLVVDGTPINRDSGLVFGIFETSLNCKYILSTSGNLSANFQYRTDSPFAPAILTYAQATIKRLRLN